MDNEIKLVKLESRLVCIAKYVAQFLDDTDDLKNETVLDPATILEIKAQRSFALELAVRFRLAEFIDE